ncbi:hypothetical protein ACN1UY_002384 [Cronobacter sakazakii]
MSTNKTLEAANLWQIERARFEERHPDQRVLLNRIEEQLHSNIMAAVILLGDLSFTVREVERKAKEKGGEA